MIDYSSLMQIFSQPRPSASAGERATLMALRSWLDQRGIRYQTQHFRLFPYSNELIGTWLLLAVLLLAATVVLRLPWPALTFVALGMALVIANVVFAWPLVVWPISSTGENLLVTFEPEQYQRELVIATHYDSKTELFDHTIAGTFFGHLTRCIVLAIIILLLGFLDRMLFTPGSTGAIAIQVVSILLTLPVVWVVGAVGLNLIPGRWITPSEGAVDNGAACVILLGLAERLAQGNIAHAGTRITLAWFAGEEVSMQGSHAFLRSRSWPLPATAVNLELLGQDGPYVLWQSEGNVLTSAPTDAQLNTYMSTIVQRVTGQHAALVGGINSDGYAFIKAGIRTCVFGSYDKQYGGSGLHRPTDNRERIVPERLAESVAILEGLIIDGGW